MPVDEGGHNPSHTGNRAPSSSPIQMPMRPSHMRTMGGMFASSSIVGGILCLAILRSASNDGADVAANIHHIWISCCLDGAATATAWDRRGSGDVRLLRTQVQEHIYMSINVC